MVLAHVHMLLELLLKSCILLVDGRVLTMLLVGIGGFFLLFRAAGNPVPRSQPRRSTGCRLARLVWEAVKR
jgi:hypothetical protein